MGWGWLGLCIRGEVKAARLAAYINGRRLPRESCALPPTNGASEKDAQCVRLEWRVSNMYVCMDKPQQKYSGC